MTRSQWAWDFLDGEDSLVDRPLSPTFTTRFDAESWLGEQWRHLVTQGVVSVRLTDRGEPVGPPLALRGA